MKKLLTAFSLLSIVSSPVSAVLCSAEMGVQNYTIPNIDPSLAAKDSKYIANSLLAKQDENLNSQDFLNYSLDKDPNKNNNVPTMPESNTSLATCFNRTFGQHANLSNMINQDSKIKDTDSNNPGESLAPSNILAFKSILDALKDSDTITNDPQIIMNIIYNLSLPKILGQFISNISPYSSPLLLNSIENLSPRAIINASASFNSDYSNRKYIASWKDHGCDHTLTCDPQSAFYIANNKLSQALKDLNGLKTNIDGDNENIASYMLLFINYISQFNAGAHVNNTISDHMFDDYLTNEVYRGKIDMELVQDNNFTNLWELIDNLAQMDTNDGKGLAQLIEILFGSESTITTTNVNSTVHLSNNQFVPDFRYYNPLRYFNQNLLLGYEKYSNSLSDVNNNEQIFPFIGGFLHDISTNQTIDNEIDEMDAMLHYFFTWYHPSMTKRIRTDNFHNYMLGTHLFMSPKNNFSIKHTFTNYKVPNIVYSCPTLWHNVYTNGISQYWKTIKIFMNQILPDIGDKQYKLPDTFDGIKSIIDSEKPIPGTNLTMADILASLDDKNGLFQYISNNWSAFNNMIQEFQTAMKNSDNIQKSINWITQNIDPSKDKTGEIKKLLSAKNPDLSIYLDIITIAISQNAFKNSCTSATANLEWFNLIGYYPNDEKKLIKKDTIYYVFIENLKLIQGFITSLDVSISSLIDSSEKPFYNEFQKISDTDISNIKVDSNWNVTYNIIDKETKKSYEIELYYNPKTTFYTLGFK